MFSTKVPRILLTRRTEIKKCNIFNQKQNIWTLSMDVVTCDKIYDNSRENVSLITQLINTSFRYQYQGRRFFFWSAFLKLVHTCIFQLQVHELCVIIILKLTNKTINLYIYIICELQLTVFRRCRVTLSNMSHRSIGMQYQGGEADSPR